MWVELKKNLSQTPSKTVSQIESIKLSKIQLKILGQIKSGNTESNTIENFESNQVRTIELWETIDTDDEDRGNR